MRRKSGATHRTAPQDPPPGLVGHAAQSRAGSATRADRARLPRGVVAFGGATVPWTHVLADVAAVHFVLNGGAQRFVDISARFDRQIRQTAGGVELIRLDDGARRTCVETARARAALIDARAHRVPDPDCVTISPRNSHDPSCWIDQAGVLADPAEAGLLRQRRVPGPDPHRRRTTLRIRDRPRRPSTAAAGEAATARRRDSRRPRRIAQRRRRQRADRSASARCCRRRRGKRPIAPSAARAGDRDARRATRPDRSSRRRGRCAIQSASRASRGCRSARAMPQRSKPTSRACAMMASRDNMVSRGRGREAITSRRAAAARTAGSRRGGTPSVPPACRCARARRTLSPIRRRAAHGRSRVERGVSAATGAVEIEHLMPGQPERCRRGAVGDTPAAARPC